MRPLFLCTSESAPHLLKLIYRALSSEVGDPELAEKLGNMKDLEHSKKRKER